MQKRLRALVPAVAATAAASVIVIGSGATAAVAAETYTVGATHFGSRVVGLDRQTPYATGLMELKDSSQKVVALTYCIDINRPTKPGTPGYTEAEWANANVKNLSQVQWILNNSFPTLDAMTIAKAAGVKSLTDEQAAAGTQAAIWHYTDGFKLDPDNNNAKVVEVYDYLVAAAAKDGGDTQKSTAVTIPAGSYKSGEKISGIKVTTTDGSASKVTLSNPAIELHYVADDSKVDLSAVKSGEEMYFTAPDGEGSLTITATGTFRLPSGRVFMRSEHQTLIVAQSKDTTNSATGIVIWTKGTVPTSTTETSTTSTTTGPCPTNTTGTATTGTPTSTCTTTPTSTTDSSTTTTPTSTSDTSTPTSTSETTSPKPTDTLPQTDTPTGTVTESTSDTTTSADTTQPAPTVTESKPHTPPLAQTGANIIGAALGALALIGAGVMFVIARRKKANG